MHLRVAGELEPSNLFFLNNLLLLIALYIQIWNSLFITEASDTHFTKCDYKIWINGNDPVVTNGNESFSKL